MTSLEKLNDIADKIRKRIKHLDEEAFNLEARLQSIEFEIRKKK